MGQMIGSAISELQGPTPSFLGGGGGGMGGGAPGGGGSPYSAVMSFLGSGASGAGGTNPGNGGSATDILNVQQGGNGILGTAGQLVSGASLANRGLSAAGYGNAQLGGIVGGAGNALGVINGVERGGVMGYGSAAVNAATLANRFGAGIPFVGPASAALATYSAVKNWKSGNTKSDTIQGAEAGAAWGSLFGPEGTVIGAGIGAAVGAVSSAFGGGTSSVEALNAQQYTAAFDKASPQQQSQMAMQASPAQNVQYLQGLMNGHNSSAGHESDLQAAFGKNNVAGFTTQMTNTINNAIGSGTLPKNATPQQIYSKVVAPWLASKAGGAKSGSDVKGSSVSAAEQASIMGVIGQWQSGGFNSKSKVGIKGQSINIPNYGG